MTDSSILFWTWVASAIAAGATVALAGIAWRQLAELRAQQQGWESLKICQQYDFDPVLNQTLTTLRAARNRGALETDPLSVRFEIVIVMNYLEGLVTGIEQGFYRESVVREHMEPIMKFHVKEFLNDDIVKKLEFEPDDYDRLRKLVQKWTSAQTAWYMRLGSEAKAAQP